MNRYCLIIFQHMDYVILFGLFVILAVSLLLPEIFSTEVINQSSQSFYTDNNSLKFIELFY